MFYIPFHYAYLFLTIPFIFIWVILYLFGRRTRMEQVHMSLLGAVLGPASELIYMRDYWIPQSAFPIYLGHFPLMFEDVIFGFAIGGIGAVVYEVILRTRTISLSHPVKGLVKGWAILLIFYFAMHIALALGANSIYASAVGFIAASLPILFKRHDLLLDAVGSGVAVTLVMFLSYFLLYHTATNSEEILKQGWLIYNTPLDVRVAGIPLTEMAWGFTFGFFAGPLYEYSSGRRLKYVKK